MIGPPGCAKLLTSYTSFSTAIQTSPTSRCSLTSSKLIWRSPVLLSLHMVRKASPLRRGSKAPPLRPPLAPKPREGFGPSVSPDVPRSVCGCTPIAFLQEHAAGCAASMIGR
eukprot:scaffold1242_cov261-Pinguiococcus_pyrenoidosus.AAC.1